MREAVIIHYNTPALTEAAIRSLQKHCGEGWHVTVFDNSDRRPFWRRMEGVSVVDNTKGQVIDWNRFLEGFPERGESEASNWGSAKHCKSVDLCFDLVPDGFLLMDSDIVVKEDVSDLCDDGVAWTGWVHCNTRRFGANVKRVCPFLCWINVPMLRESGIRYFNPEKMWRLTAREPGCWYDTGAWLLEATKANGLPCRRLGGLDGYIEHFRGGSWRKSEKSEQLWLAAMSNYFI